MGFLGWVIPTILLIVVIRLQLSHERMQRNVDFLYIREIHDKQKEHSSMLYELLDLAKSNRDCIGFLQDRLNKIEVDIEMLRREFKR